MQNEHYVDLVPKILSTFFKYIKIHKKWKKFVFIIHDFMFVIKVSKTLITSVFKGLIENIYGILPT